MTIDQDDNKIILDRLFLLTARTIDVANERGHLYDELPKEKKSDIDSLVKEVSTIMSTKLSTYIVTSIQNKVN